jgi:hypothetical protein
MRPALLCGLADFLGLRFSPAGGYCAAAVSIIKRKVNKICQVDGIDL